MLESFFKNKKVIVTGHTGFKGSWLTAWLKILGAHVIGVALDPPTSPSHFEVAALGAEIKDIRLNILSGNNLIDLFVDVQPDFVFHLAAQSLVRVSYENPVDTWQTNVIGTVNILEALRNIRKQCSAVIVTSDKCYLNKEWVWGYKETDELGGLDPYSASKAAAEVAITSYIKSYFGVDGDSVRIASARAGNVIGGGDWARDRIIPDCVRAWSSKQVVELRNPLSTRPWQHVLEPLSGYLCLAMALSQSPRVNGEAFNFGPVAAEDKSVLDLVSGMASHWNAVQWKILTNANELHESGLLKLNCDKALHYLDWGVTMNFDETIKMTADWYQNYYENSQSIYTETTRQIDFYTEIARGKGMKWAQK